MSEELSQEVKSVLGEILNKGSEIKEALKLKFNHPSKRSQEEILTDPNIFYYSLYEGFWKIFEQIKNNIENPLVQPWIRVIIESASDILWYSQKDEDDKKDIACQYFLCTLGILGGKQGNLNYDSFLTLLINSKEKNQFEDLKKKGYPIKEIHKRWHNLFPPISEDSLPNVVEEYFLTMENNPIKKEQLDIFFRHMSLYHHPSLMINNLDRESKDQSHVFRCFSLISICGLSLIRFSTSKEEINKDSEFIKLNQKVNELIKKLNLDRKNETAR
jgi:hypothetical protein